MATTIIGTLATRRGERYGAPGQLPPPCGFPAYDDLLAHYLAEVEQLRSDVAALDRANQALAKAKAEYPDAVYQARIAGKTEPKDPAPAAEAKLEAAQRAVDISEYTVVQTWANLAEVREGSELHDHALAQYEERLDRIATTANEADSQLDDLAESQYLLQWAGGSHKPSRALDGRSHLTAFRRWLGKRADKQQPRFVSPAAMRALNEGKDVQDIEGRALSWEEADGLSRVGKLKTSYGKLRPRSSTGWGDAG
jgi:hypothetical protein